jgi:hypothetical protein
MAVFSWYPKIEGGSGGSVSQTVTRDRRETNQHESHGHGMRPEREFRTLSFMDASASAQAFEGNETPERLTDYAED